MALTTALVVLDSPYALTQETWDVQLTATFLDTMLKQVDASQTGNNTIVLIWHKPTDSNLVKTALLQRMYQEFTHLYWHKPGHQSQTAVNTFTSTVEMATIAFNPAKPNLPMHMERDPRDRHNFVEIPSVTKYFRDANGVVINPCQKPRELMAWVCHRLVPVGGNVLVLGFGAGGEILGCVDARVNVVGVEADERQFVATQATLLRLNDSPDDQNNKDADSSTSTTAELDENEDESQQPASAGAQNSEGEIQKMPTECFECGSILEEGYDPLLVCDICIIKVPYHPNCCNALPNGNYRCVMCFTKHGTAEVVASTQ